MSALFLLGATRIGRIKWNGLPLYTSYRTFIGGKDVELTDEITKSQLPRITGTSDELPELDPESDGPPADNSWLLQSRQSSMAPDTSRHSMGSNSPSVLKSFIPPASFYAQPSKPKLKGPL